MTEVRTRFTTANIRHSLSYRKARADYEAALADSDILCTQEMNRRHAAAFVPDGWGTAQYDEGGYRSRTAIHWREDRFKKKTWGVSLLHVSRLFPSATRSFTWVQLYDVVTRRNWTIVNVHMVPHADDERGGITHYPRRRLVLTALQILLLFARATRGQLVIMGDFNTDLRKDLANVDPQAVVEQMHTGRLVASAEVLGVPARSTHGKNLYDQVYFRLRDNPKVRLVGHHVHPKRNSDHCAYTVEAMVSVKGTR